MTGELQRTNVCKTRQNFMILDHTAVSEKCWGRELIFTLASIGFTLQPGQTYKTQLDHTPLSTLFTTLSLRQVIKPAQESNQLDCNNCKCMQQKNIHLSCADSTQIATLLVCFRDLRTKSSDRDVGQV